jgi:predicted alpha/beta superfamily hydrolase
MSFLYLQAQPKTILMNYLIARFALLCYVLLINGGFAYAQPQTPANQFNNTKEITLHSNILNEERKIYLHLPNHWQEKSYPVLILIDGEYIELYEEALNTMHTNKDVPKHIVVGIDNHLNRNRDLLPVEVKNRPGSGKADKFLRFIQKELIPHINQQYNAKQERILFGGSNGGLFVLYTMFTNPDLFSGYITSSPMIGHCPQFMEKQLKSFNKTEHVRGKPLFIYYGMKDRFKQATNYLPAYTSELKKHLGEHMRIKIVCLPEGGHVPPGGIEQGLEFYYLRVK